VLGVVLIGALVEDSCLVHAAIVNTTRIEKILFMLLF